LTATRPALERINELDALGASWRLALDAAQAALQAAPAALSPEALDGRATLLAAERTQTAQLLGLPAGRVDADRRSVVTRTSDATSHGCHADAERPG
jgi:hypothetical protein